MLFDCDLGIFNSIEQLILYDKMDIATSKNFQKTFSQISYREQLPNPSSKNLVVFILKAVSEIISQLTSP